MMVLSLCSTVALLVLSCDYSIDETSLSQGNRSELKYRLQEFFNILGETSTIKELELSKEQIQKLKTIGKEYSSKASKASKAYYKTRGNSALEKDPQAAKAILNKASELVDKKYSELAKESLVKMEEILLPHQARRVRQMALQKQLQQQLKGGKFEMLEAIVPRLRLTSAQRKKFLGQLEESRIEYEKKQADLWKKTERNILSVLPPEAKKLLKDLVGEIVD